MLQFQLVNQFLETLAVFRNVDRVWRGAYDGHAIGFEIAREFQRRLPSVLHDYAVRLFDVHDFKHIFERQRLEIQPVGRIVVGRYRLRVAIDHDGLETVFAQRECCMHAAIVEFDALPDAIRPAAQHDHLLAVGRLRLALFLVGRIHIRGVGGEFRRAGVDTLVDRAYAERVTMIPHLGFGRLHEIGQAAIGETFALQPAQFFGAEVADFPVVEFHFEIDDFLDLHQEPAVYFGELINLFERKPVLERVANIPDALRPRLAEFFFDGLAVGRFLIEAVGADFEPAQGFLE